MAKIQKHDTTNAGEDVEQWDLVHCWRDSHLGRQFGGFLQN